MEDGMANEHDAPATGTGTLAAARDHARQQAGSGRDSGPQVPSGSVALPADADRARPVWAEPIPPFGYASRRLARGTVLRVSDPVGTACVQLLVHNARQPAERLNIADTVKVQWQAYLGTGALLLSDMGRALMTIVSDTSAGHDCLCGCTVRTGAGDRASEGRPNGRDLLALGVAKFGLDRRDLAPNVNLLRRVVVDDDGGLHFDPTARPGAYVELRAEMDVLVTLANTPHPLDPTSDPPEMHCLAWYSPPGADATDPLRSATPERARAFLNTDEYLLGFAS